MCEEWLVYEGQKLSGIDNYNVKLDGVELENVSVEYVRVFIGDTDELQIGFIIPRLTNLTPTAGEFDYMFLQNVTHYRKSDTVSNVVFVGNKFYREAGISDEHYTLIFNSFK